MKINSKETLNKVTWIISNDDFVFIESMQCLWHLVLFDVRSTDFLLFFFNSICNCLYLIPGTISFEIISVQMLKSLCRVRCAVRILLMRLWNATLKSKSKIKNRNWNLLSLKQKSLIEFVNLVMSYHLCHRHFPFGVTYCFQIIQKKKEEKKNNFTDEMNNELFYFSPFWSWKCWGRPNVNWSWNTVRIIPHLSDR